MAKVNLPKQEDYQLDYKLLGEKKQPFHLQRLPIGDGTSRD